MTKLQRFEDLAQGLIDLENVLRRKSLLATKSRLSATADHIGSYPLSGAPKDREEYLVKLGDPSEDDPYLSGVHRFRHLLFDAMELVDTCQETDWDAELSAEHAGKWKVVSGGSVFLDVEKPESYGTHPRNLLFELSMAAFFQQRGLKVEIASDGDLVVSFQGTQVRVECKRIFSPRRLAPNLTKATRQLAATDELTPTGLYIARPKIVCLSVDPLYYAHFNQQREDIGGEERGSVLLPTPAGVKEFTSGLHENHKPTIKRALTGDPKETPGGLACVTLLTKAVGLHNDELKRITWAVIDEAAGYKELVGALFAKREGLDQ